MVIDIVDIYRVAAGETKYHPPIGSDRNRPETPQFALKWMQPEPRQIHVFDRASGVKSSKNIPQLLYVFR